MVWVPTGSQREPSVHPQVQRPLARCPTPPTADLRPRTGAPDPVQQHAQACCEPPTSHGASGPRAAAREVVLRSVSRRGRRRSQGDAPPTSRACRVPSNPLKPCAAVSIKAPSTPHRPQGSTSGHQPAQRPLALCPTPQPPIARKRIELALPAVDQTGTVWLPHDFACRGPWASGPSARSEGRSTPRRAAARGASPPCEVGGPLWVEQKQSA